MYRPPEPPGREPTEPTGAPVEIGKHLVISTSHVSLMTSRLLEAWAGLPAEDRPMTVATTWHGWFVSTFKVEGHDARLIPPELAEVQRFGRALGCAFILFDCDGEEVQGLPTFSW